MNPSLTSALLSSDSDKRNKSNISPFNITWKDIKHFYRKDNWPLIACDVIGFSFPFLVYGICRFVEWVRLC